MGVANSGYFSALLAPGLRKVYFETSKEFPEEFSKIANVLTSKKAYEEDIMAAGLGLFQRKPEGQGITYDNGLIGTPKRFTHVSFGLGFKVTREMYDDDQYDVMKKMSRQLARAARLTVEMEFGALIDDLFTGGTYTGYDSAAICSTAHILLNGTGSIANKPSTDADLGITTLRAAIENLEATLDDRGLPYPLQGVQLVVSPTFQWQAEEITQSSAKPYTSDNEVNTLKDRGLKPFVYHYMTDADQWMVFAPKADHDFKFFWRTKPEFNNSDDFETKDAKFSGFMRFSMGVTNWRGVYGSSGG